MMNKVQACEYNQENDLLEKEEFDWVEDAFAWCEARRQAPIFWGDTEFGYQGMTEAERDSGVGFPPKWYEVHAVNEEGEVDYLTEDNHKSGEFRA